MLRNIPNRFNTFGVLNLIFMNDLMKHEFKDILEGRSLVGFAPTETMREIACMTVYNTAYKVIENLTGESLPRKTDFGGLDVVRFYPFLCLYHSFALLMCRLLSAVHNFLATSR